MTRLEWTYASGEEVEGRRRREKERGRGKGEGPIKVKRLLIMSKCSTNIKIADQAFLGFFSSRYLWRDVLEGREGGKFLMSENCK